MSWDNDDEIDHGEKKTHLHGERMAAKKNYNNKFKKFFERHKSAIQVDTCRPSLYCLALSR